MNKLDRIVYETAVKELVLQTTPVIVADMYNGVIIYASPTAGLLFGRDHEGLNGTCVDELLPLEVRDNHARHRASYAQAPRPRPPTTGLILLGRKSDGTEFPIQVALQPAEIMGRSVVVATLMDLTELVKTTALIQQAASTQDQQSNDGASPEH